MSKGSPVLAFDVWCMQSLQEPSLLWAGRSNSVLRIWAGGGLLGGAHNPACPCISLLWDFFVVQRECKRWTTPLLGLLWNHSGSFKRFPYWEGCPVIKWLLPKKQWAGYWPHRLGVFNSVLSVLSVFPAPLRVLSSPIRAMKVHEGTWGCHGFLLFFTFIPTL